MTAGKSSYKKGGMFEGALHTVFENAKQLRSQMTDAETILWMHLKAGVLGCKFRRQHPIGRFIADFYCHKAKLVVEVDGGIHEIDEVKRADEEKENYLANAGYGILRFSNQEIINNVESVLQKITTVLIINSNNYNNTPNFGG